MKRLIMDSGHCYIEFDRTGFPLIRKKGWNYSISLFPISKYQFESFMIEKGPRGGLYTDDWYRELLKLNPRRSWKDCDTNPWELFLTGVKYKDLRYFFKFMGRDFRLPTPSEWKELHKASKEIKQIKANIIKLCKEKAAPPVSHWIENDLFPLTDEGLFEIVIENNNVCCIGKPYYKLFSNLYNPTSVREVNWKVCKNMIGFRIVKSSK